MERRPKTLQPFIKMCATIGALPTSYLVSMTYEEQLLWLCNFLEKEVIPVVNNNSEVVKELQEWFENLDVQEEVDNKIDEMYESGQLQEIIIQYLELTGVMGFDTVADMKAATNLIDGSICKTLGTLNYMDGYGNYYKVRTVTVEDVIDEINIISLTNYNTLIAELIPNTYISNINTSITNVDNKIGDLTNLSTTSKTNVVSAINEVNAKFTPNPEKIVMYGDSYARGSTGTELIDSWCKRVATMMGKENDYYSMGVSGGAFYNATMNSSFDSLVSLVPVAERPYVTKFILGCGANDYIIPSAQTDIETNILALMDSIKINFPNAKIYVCFIGYKNILTDTFATVRANLRDVIKKYSSCINKGALFAGNICYILHNPELISLTDGTHPNEDGYQEISQAIYNFVESGKSFIRPQLKGYSITAGTNYTINQSISVALCDEVTIWNAAEFTVTATTAVNTNNVGVLEIGTFEDPIFFRPNASTTLIASGTALLTHNDNTQENVEISLRMGYTGQAYLVFNKQYNSIKSVRSRCMRGVAPTVNC